MNQVSDSFFDVERGGEPHDIVSVGRLTAQKNQALLIRAFARIAGRTKEKLRLYGAGELREELQALIESLGLSERVRLMGLSGNVAGDVRNARMFVLSSDYEGLPNALLEAMAMGLPCVSTDCQGGGPAMVIENGVNGLLTPIGDEEALAAAMLRLLQNPEEAEAMGRAAKKAAERFRPDAVFEQWRQYAEDILHG
jgi:glycosyltransferase involved in cell wall biosynthesis